MLKQFALVVGLTLAGGMAAYAMPTTAMNNGNEHANFSSSEMTNSFMKRESVPVISSQFAMTQSGIQHQRIYGFTKKNSPTPEVASTTPSSASRADLDDGYARRETPAGPRDMD